MDLKLTEKNKLTQAIKSLKISIEREEQTICRFQQMNGDNHEVIDKRSGNLQTMNITLSSTEERLCLLMSGSLEAELKNNALLARDEISKKNNESMRKKAEILADKKILSDKSVAYYKAGKKTDRIGRRTNNDIKYFYKYFCKVCDSIPEWMIKKLAKMPNNEGFIWKGVFCYGELPINKSDEGKIKMEERKNKDLVLYHEWSKNIHTIVEKRTVITDNGNNDGRNSNNRNSNYDGSNSNNRNSNNNGRNSNNRNSNYDGSNSNNRNSNNNGRNSNNNGNNNVNNNGRNSNNNGNNNVNNNGRNSNNNGRNSNNNGNNNGRKTTSIKHVCQRKNMNIERGGELREHINQK
jgi:hypothetical protein